MNYEIREMNPEDSAAVLKIFAEGSETGNATVFKQASSWENWDRSYLKECRLVLENEANEVVGWAALQSVSSRQSYRGVAEVSIYLTGSVQGRGLGTMLLKKLILDSEKNGFWTLQTSVFPHNKAGISVHQKLGFRIVGTRERIAHRDGIWRDVLLLERRSNVVGN